MIYVTVGTQLAFDRMIKVVDEWAAQSGEQVVAQIGPATYQPRHMSSSPFLSPEQAQQHFEAADLIVSHAGMGSILNALQLQRPIIIFPRSAALGEHRNEHQMATAKRMEGRPGVHVAWHEQALTELLQNRRQMSTGTALSELAAGPLVSRLRAYIQGVA